MIVSRPGVGQSSSETPSSSGGTPPGGKKGIESGESDPGYESDSTKMKRQQQQLQQQQQQLVTNTVKLSVAGAAAAGSQDKLLSPENSSHHTPVVQSQHGKTLLKTKQGCNPPETKSLIPSNTATVKQGPIYQSKLFHAG